jgi:hypothetical protein
MRQVTKECIQVVVCDTAVGRVEVGGLAPLLLTILGVVRPDRTVIVAPNLEFNNIYKEEEKPVRGIDEKYGWSRAEFQAMYVSLYPQY